MTALEAIAHHEAGHGVVGELLRLPSLSVSIIKTSDRLGQHRLSTPLIRLPHSIQHLCLWSFAGPESEKWFTRSSQSVNAWGDYEFIKDILTLELQQKVRENPCLDLDTELNKRASLYEKLALGFIITHERWVQVVAMQLLIEKVLPGHAIRDLRPETDPGWSEEG